MKFLGLKSVKNFFRSKKLVFRSIKSKKSVIRSKKRKKKHNRQGESMLDILYEKK